MRTEHWALLCGLFCMAAVVLVMNGAAATAPLVLILLGVGGASLGAGIVEETTKDRPRTRASKS